MVAPHIERLSDGAGIRIFDPIETQECRLSTPAAVDPVAADPDRFDAPIDTAATIRTESLTLPGVATAYVRDEERNVRGEILHDSEATFGPGRYSVELSLPVKLYVRARGPMTVASEERTTLTFDGEREVVVGARSYHEHPAATVTTTDDPADLMRAVSTFGSALKTFSPERSFPTLRGHPPLIERGDRFAAPDGIDVPDTGVTIALPADRRYVYAAAPLAYYLGAEVVPGDRPALRTDDGWTRPLDVDGADLASVAATINRTLKQAFFFDCCARSEGLQDVRLYERCAVEGRVGLDFEALYDRPLAERLPAYFSVAYEMIEEYVPAWDLAATVTADPENAETLPYLAESLALIEPDDTPDEAGVGENADWREEMETELDGFFRGTSAARPVHRGPAPERIAGDPAAYDGDSGAIAETFVGPLDEKWRGSRAIPAGFEHRLQHADTEGPLRIVVVCNDERMIEEGNTVDEVYRNTGLFETDIRRDVDTDELRDLLAADADFLHYIGHIEAGGFVCEDGLLDVREMDAVGPAAFFLNACASYDQGAAMVEQGSVAGVVTNDAVANEGATRIGRTFARLLDAGFTVYSALNIARTESVHGGRYAVLGDGRVAVSQSAGVPYLLELETNAAGTRGEFTVEFHPTTGIKVGTLAIPTVTESNNYYLSHGRTEPFERPIEEVRSFASDQPCPVLFDGELRWSTNLDL